MKRMLLSTFLLTALLAAAARGDDRPNIILILADDLGWSDLGCYGHPYHQTPNIDRLASQGVRLTNGYSPAPICSAARASILTGKTTARLGFEFVTKYAVGPQQLDSPVPLAAPPYKLNLPLTEKTIAERLKELNYSTAFFGKWHVSQHFQKRYLAWHPKFGPRKQGFDFAVEDFGDHPYAWRKKKPVDAPEGVFPADSMMERTAEYILRKHDQPYFLMASSFYVHTPVKNRCRWLVKQYDSKVPKDAKNRNKRLEYAAFVQTLDHHVGTILKAVDQSGQRENTLVVFLSDNGGHPEYSSNAPLRGSKWNLYEGGVRVPWIVRWPARIEANTRLDAPVIGYDLLPTFVEIASGKSSDLGETSIKIDGVSVAKQWAGGGATIERPLIWHFPYYHPESTFSSALDEVGVSDFATSKTRPQSAIRHRDFKLIKFAEDDSIALYDLNADIGEQNDLSGKLPAIAKQLDTLLERKLSEMNARRASRRSGDDNR